MGKIFITGGAGFIGSHLAEELSSNGSTIVIYDNLSTGNITNLIGVPHSFTRGDILDYESLKKAMSGCRYVFHLAAATSVVESMSNPEKYIEINARGTLNVLRAAEESGVEKIVFASSAAVYGDSPVLPKTEAMRPEPASPYAITKLDGEYYCGMFAGQYRLAYVAARFFNVFGERQDPTSPYAAAIPIFLSKIKNSEPINIFGDGEQTRDFIYVKDIAKALIFLIKNGAGVYNIGYGRTITINELVELLKKTTGKNVTIRHVDERPGEIRHSYASVKKLLDEGFNPEHDLEKGLERTVKWWMENRDE